MSSMSWIGRGNIRFRRLKPPADKENLFKQVNVARLFSLALLCGLFTRTSAYRYA